MKYSLTVVYTVEKCSRIFDINRDHAVCGKKNRLGFCVFIREKQAHPQYLSKKNAPGHENPFHCGQDDSETERDADFPLNMAEPARRKSTGKKTIKGKLSGFLRGALTGQDEREVHYPPIRQSYSPPVISSKGIRLKNRFLATVPGDKETAFISDLICLPGGLILLTDYENLSLKLFNEKGDILQSVPTQRDLCCLIHIGCGRVAFLKTHAQTLQILKVSAKNIKRQSIHMLEKKYWSGACFDSTFLAAVRYKSTEIDLMSTAGQIYQTIVTSETVRRAHPMPDGSLVCTYYRCHLHQENEYGILKIDTFKGAEKSKKPLPGAGELVGVTTWDDLLVVCDSKRKTLYLLDSDGNLIQNLWHVSRLDRSGDVWWVSVLDTTMVFCTDSRVFVLELVDCPETRGSSVDESDEVGAWRI